jgi:hypothetical protein
MAPNMSGGFNPRAKAEGEVVLIGWGRGRAKAGAGEIRVLLVEREKGPTRRRSPSWSLGNNREEKIAGKCWWPTAYRPPFSLPALDVWDAGPRGSQCKQNIWPPGCSQGLC